MSDAARVKKSRYLTRALRHRPERIGIVLDEAGWVSVAELCAACTRHGVAIDAAELTEIVRESDKQRFAFSDDGLRVRAQQGHSVEVDLGYEPAEPPELLFHGTVRKVLAAIREQGISRGSRHHVHLSPDRETAIRVGGRRGKPVVLVVYAKRMAKDGFVFMKSGNDVWLTEHVPPQYLDAED
jgi:putative RNA 2'-phosphotransferase